MTFESFPGAPGNPGYPDTPATPDWAEVHEDGSITVRPGHDVEIGVYHVPVQVTYPPVDGNEIPPTVIFASVEVVSPGYYDDAMTTPGTLVKVNINNEIEMDPDLVFTVGESTVPDGWTATVDSNIGELVVYYTGNPEGENLGRVTGDTITTEPLLDEAGNTVGTTIIINAGRDDEQRIEVRNGQDGVPGETGPQGPQGENGPEGQQGEPGQDAPTVTGTETRVEERTGADGKDGRGTEP